MTLRVHCVSVMKAVPELVDMAMQTNWKYPKNAAVQCQPREFTDQEKLSIQESDELAEFVRNVSQRFVSRTTNLSLLCYWGTADVTA